MSVTVNLSLIKNAREKKGYTQQTMADKLGLKDKSRYSRRENGVYSFQLEELPLLAETLDIPYENFFGSNVAKNETYKEVVLRKTNHK